MRVVARWETKGKDFFKLQEEDGHYFYNGYECGGTLPLMSNDESAIAYMEAGPVATLKLDRPSTKRVEIVLKGA